MENIIQEKVNNILKELNINYSQEKKEVIIEICNCLKENNLDLFKIEENHLKMFINHILVLFARLDNNEILNMDNIELMFSELKQQSIKIAKEIIMIVKKSYEVTITDTEVFLIATHIENILNQQ